MTQWVQFMNTHKNAITVATNLNTIQIINKIVDSQM